MLCRKFRDPSSQTCLADSLGWTSLVAEQAAARDWADEEAERVAHTPGCDYPDGVGRCDCNAEMRVATIAAALRTVAEEGEKLGVEAEFLRWRKAAGEASRAERDHSDECEKRIKGLEQQLTEAAMEIDCSARDKAHRIRILKLEHEHRVERLVAEGEKRRDAEWCNTLWPENPEGAEPHVPTEAREWYLLQVTAADQRGYERGVREEQEACAKIVEAEEWEGEPWTGLLKRIAACLRERARLEGKG